MPRDVLYAFMHAYLVERDVEKCLTFVTDDVYSIGTGIFETAAGKAELEALLRAEVAGDPAPFSFSFDDVREKRCTDGGDFFARLTVRKELENCDVMSVDMRQTAHVSFAGGAGRIASVHVSIAAGIQEQQEFYPVRFGKKTLDGLKNKLRERTFNFLNNSIAGGMIGGYMEEGFPLYFVNRKLLSFLGYESYAEFVRDIEGLVNNGIHPDDRAYVNAVVAQSLYGGDEYEVRYRMLKKDKSWIWVLDRGKRIISEDGRPAIISVCFDITESVLLQQALEEKSQRLWEKNRELEQFYSIAVTGIAKVTGHAGGVFLYGNDSYYQMLGYTRETFALRNGQDYVRTIFPADREEVLRILRNCHEGSRSHSRTFRLLKADDTCLWVRLDVTRSEERHQGRPVLYCLFSDINEQKEQEEEYRRREYYSNLILSRIAGGIVVTRPDADRSIVFRCENFLRFLGYSPEDAHRLPDTLRAVIRQEDADGSLEDMRAQLAGQDAYETEYRVERNGGGMMWVLDKGARMTDWEGRPIVVSFLIDVSERRFERDQLLRDSQRDSLTQLYNRGATEALIREAMARKGRAVGHAFFLIDVDHFKALNDTLGHIFGDSVLRCCAGELRAVFRGGDIIGRIGGDEFVVFMKNVADRSHAAEKAEQVLGAFRRMTCPEGRSIRASCSIGVAMFPDHGETFAACYGRADLALYEAKARGRNRYVMFDLRASVPQRP